VRCRTRTAAHVLDSAVRNDLQFARQDWPPVAATDLGDGCHKFVPTKSILKSPCLAACSTKAMNSWLISTHLYQYGLTFGGPDGREFRVGKKNAGQRESPRVAVLARAHVQQSETFLVFQGASGLRVDADRMVSQDGGLGGHGDPLAQAQGRMGQLMIGVGQGGNFGIYGRNCSGTRPSQETTKGMRYAMSRTSRTWPSAGSSRIPNSWLAFHRITA